MDVSRTAPPAASYPAAWRALHWITALAVATLLAAGLWMTARGGAGIWDGLTNTLYAWHKAIGICVLLLTALRVAIRLRLGVPPYPQTLSPTRRRLAVGLNHVLYALLVAVPLFGWAGVTAYPALVTIGGVDLPAMPLVPRDNALAELLVQIHGALALLLVAHAAGHAAMGLHHLFAARDGVFQRMWPRAGRTRADRQG
jgi:cytochrome b561